MQGTKHYLEGLDVIAIAKGRQQQLIQERNEVK